MYLTVELEHYIYATNQVFQINILSTLIKICCSTWEKKMNSRIYSENTMHVYVWLLVNSNLNNDPFVRKSVEYRRTLKKNLGDSYCNIFKRDFRTCKLNFSSSSSHVM